jgi:hypothetical protein
MQTLNQLISEATALPDADKAIAIDKIMESMAEPIDSRNERLLQGKRSATANVTSCEKA